jgi:hypothetical protein
MSGIFKSVKKVFKKIAKVVKKIAPYLLLAAGVYFGGAYLMSSMGGAGAAASSTIGMGQAFQGAGFMERVTGAFKVSGGVWKSFFGGLGTTAGGLKSAAAFANGTYNAMTSGAALSAGILGGTEAVAGIANGMSMADAVAGAQTAVSNATQLTGSGMAPVEASTQALSQVDTFGKFGKSPTSTFGLQPGAPSMMGTPQAMVPENYIPGGGPDATMTANAPATQAFADPLEYGGTPAAAAADQNLASASAAATDPTTPKIPSGGLISTPPAEAPVPKTYLEMIMQQGQAADKRIVTAMEQQNTLTKLQMDRSYQAQQLQLGFQGMGLLASAFKPDTIEEKEWKHSKNWMPSKDMVDLDTLAPKPRNSEVA